MENNKKITIEEVKYVAKLANLELTSEEEAKFADQLGEVIDYNMGLLSEVNTDNVDPLFQVNDDTNRHRDDETQPSLTQEQVLKNASSTHNGFFKVKAILEDNGSS